MSPEGPEPQLFVARDRARRWARRLGEAREDRTLTYLGAERGMAVLAPGSQRTFDALEEDLRGTMADVLAGRLRDRERGYMEVPLVALGEALLSRLAAARALDRSRSRGASERSAAERAVLALIEEAGRRVDEYCARYDRKRPAGPLEPVDLPRLLARVEEDAANASGRGATPAPAADRDPPWIDSDAAALDDLLRAARASLPDAPGPWRVEPGGPDRPLVLRLGDPAGGDEAPPPEPVARAAAVLAFLHPTEVRAFERAAARGGLLSAAVGGPRLVALEVRIPDPGAGGIALSLEAAAGPGARLPPGAEAAVRALRSAPPLPPHGAAPAARQVAIAGVLRALDDTLARTLLPRGRAGAVRAAALLLPREDTRKAPLRRDLLEAVEQRFEGFPSHLADDLARLAAEGRFAPRHGRPAEMAALVALFALPWRAQGREFPPSLDLAPLTEADAAALVQDLCDLHVVRRDLEAGRPVEVARVTRLERAALGVLGRLGRLGRPA
jgi:hypothetical protein